MAAALALTTARLTLLRIEVSIGMRIGPVGYVWIAIHFFSGELMLATEMRPA